MRLIGLAVVLAVSLALMPLDGETQETEKMWRIGFLSPYSADFDKTWRAAFQHGLRDLGYVQGKNLIIEERHVKGRYEQFPELAAELVRLKIDVFVLHGASSQIVRAAEQASSTIPIIFVANPDPRARGQPCAARWARHGTIRLSLWPGRQKAGTSQGDRPIDISRCGLV